MRATSSNRDYLRSSSVEVSQATSDEDLWAAFHIVPVVINPQEYFILNEITAWLAYSRSRLKLSFWRDRSGNEVDFMIGDGCAVEVKHTKRVQPNHGKGISALSEEVSLKTKIIVSLDSEPRLMNGILVLPWKEFCGRLWEGEIV